MRRKRILIQYRFFKPDEYAEFARGQDNLFNEVESLAMWATLEVELLYDGDFKVTYHPWPNKEKKHA